MTAPVWARRCRALLRLWAAAALAVAIALVGIAVPGPAGAEQCTREVRLEAKRLKKRGFGIRESDPEGAARAFKAAHELCPSPWYLGHLALLYEKLGHVSAAIDVLDEYLEDENAAQREQALAGRERLRALLARVEVTTEPPGAEIWIDGEPLTPRRESPTTLELEAGDYTVEVRLSGYRPAREEISVESSEERDLQLALEPRERRAEPEPEPEPEPGLRWTVSLQAGVGVTFPLGTDMIGTAFAIPIDIAGGIDLRTVRIELLAQLFVFPDVNGTILQVGGGLRLGIKMGRYPLYLGLEAALGWCRVSVNTTGRMIPQGTYSSFGVEPALFLSWQAHRRVELVARPLRFEVMGIGGDLPGGVAARLGIDVGARVRF
jgi:hypothetical protein